MLGVRSLLLVAPFVIVCATAEHPVPRPAVQLPIPRIRIISPRSEFRYEVGVDVPITLSFYSHEQWEDVNLLELIATYHVKLLIDNNHEEQSLVGVAAILNSRLALEGLSGGTHRLDVQLAHSNGTAMHCTLATAHFRIGPAWVGEEPLIRSMHTLGMETGTDKVTQHGYHRHYDGMLSSLRNRPVSMLEIGVDRGGSLKMWQSYFSNATIFGVDIDSSYSSEEERVHIYKGDQSDVGFLNQVKQQVRGISPLLLDLLIDDGSHVPEHQIIAFQQLFPLVKPGGLFIIEDIETSYWKDGKVYGHEVNVDVSGSSQASNAASTKFRSLSVINIFKKAIDRVLNREFHQVPSGSVLGEQELHIESIQFATNCIIIRKQAAGTCQYWDRKYRFGDSHSPRYRD